MSNLCEISSLNIPAKMPYTGAASVYVEAIAAVCGFNSDQSRQLAQSLLKILQDLISHAVLPGENQEVQISCQRLASGLKILISEKGLPLSPAELTSLSPDPGACLLMPPEDFTCVREVWDEAIFKNLGKAGAQVELVKYFAGEAGKHSEQACPEVSPAEPPAPAVKPETFTIRPFIPEDAQEVTRLLYRTYGYSYPYENLYYPEKITALNADGMLQSLLAVSSRGQLVGHLSLYFRPESPNLAEMGTALVHPDFRGHGCLRQLTEYALREVSRRGLQGMYGSPVTNHTYSQKVSEELGFTSCGLFLGFGPASMSFKKIHEELPQRESMILMYRRLLPPAPIKIYPPPRHRDIIMRLYAEIGVTPETAADSGASEISDAPGNLEVNMYPGNSIAFLKMKIIGRDSVEQLRRHLKHLCLAHFEVMHLHLDLCRPEVPQFVPQCESLGFFFAGILPGLDNTQTLILQYLNNVSLEYDRIQLHSSRSKELLEYVRQQDPNIY